MAEIASNGFRNHEFCEDFHGFPWISLQLQLTTWPTLAR